MYFNIFLWEEKGIVAGWHNKSGYFSFKQRGATFFFFAAKDINWLIDGAKVY